MIDTDLTPIFNRHFQKLLGEEFTIYTEGQGIQIRRYAPTAQRPFEILTTFGLSARPGPVPEAYQNECELFPDQEWAELMLCLPIGISQEYRRWSAGMLSGVAVNARDTRRYVGHSQFFDLLPTSAHPWVAVSLQYPELLPASCGHFRGPVEENCHWYAAIPVMEEEIQVRRSAGSERFLSGLSSGHVTELLDPNRISFLTPRLYA